MSTLNEIPIVSFDIKKKVTTCCYYYVSSIITLCAKKTDLKIEHILAHIGTQWEFLKVYLLTACDVIII
jgi:hypothetical protein